MNLSDIKQFIKYHGFRNATTDLFLRAVNKLLFLKILQCIKIEEPNSGFLKHEETYNGSFLDESTLRRFSKHPEYELSEEFLDKALGKGDACYGFMANNDLAAYGWYSNKPTGIDRPELVLHFSDQYIYMYKGFTHPDHRGKRLHASGMTRALKAYLDAGYRGIVSYVEANNFASLKSCYRMGYTDVGRIYAAQLFGHYLLYSEAGCRRHDMKIKKIRNG